MTDDRTKIDRTKEQTSHSDTRSTADTTNADRKSARIESESDSSAKKNGGKCRVPKRCTFADEHGLQLTIVFVEKQIEETLSDDEENEMDSIEDRSDVITMQLITV